MRNMITQKIAAAARSFLFGARRGGFLPHPFAKAAKGWGTHFREVKSNTGKGGAPGTHGFVSAPSHQIDRRIKGLLLRRPALRRDTGPRNRTPGPCRA